MSKATLTKTSSTGTYLKDCLHSQNYFLSLEIDDPNGEVLCRAAMSYDQFVRLLVDSSEVTVTLEKYRSKEGKIESEKVDPPASVQDRLVERLEDVQSSLANRMADLRKDLYELVNSGKPVGKKALETLLHDIGVIEDHYRSNQSFTVQQASEEVHEIQENAKAQLSIFLTSKGFNVTPDQVTPMIESASVKQLPHYEEPIREQYTRKQREQKSLEEMTAMEVADELSARLSRLEKMQSKDDEKNALFGSNATHERNNVLIRYISYQGTNKLSLEEARDYLGFLRMVKSISDFKSNHWYKRSNV